ncbi:MAG: tRNA uridine-5-carboxymethylaminomethyl(34) synthesis GTPase MnmE [Bdellovibrionia bacterium]
MNVLNRDADTICAVATPPGVGGISVIRVSGPNSLDIVKRSAGFIPNEPESHRVFFGNFRSAQNNENIDEVLISYFKQGRSFTGEETLEISCHGNPVICERILKELLSHGARLAERGEFTYRSFMNGKMDLIQAESVLELIEAQSKEASQLALRQLKGSLSDKIRIIDDRITWLAAHIEAGIDFSTEDIVIIEPALLKTKLTEVFDLLSELLATYQYGRLVKDGIKVVLTGLPNVGKSSLLNQLLEDDKAIVTNIPGTTRDLIDGDTFYKGFKFTFIDTAGLRQTVDQVEAIGVERSYSVQRDADIILFVYDSSQVLKEDEIAVLNKLDLSKTWVIANKFDLLSDSTDSVTQANGSILSKIYSSHSNLKLDLNSRMLFVSALDKKVREAILDRLAGENKNQHVDSSALVSNVRHFELLTFAKGNILKALDVAESADSAEFLAFELKEALMKIHEVLGRRFDDEIMDRVFKEFCIGK